MEVFAQGAKRVVVARVELGDGTGELGCVAEPVDSKNKPYLLPLSTHRSELRRIFSNL